MHTYSTDKVFTIRAVREAVEDHDAEQLPTAALDRVPSIQVLM